MLGNQVKRFPITQKLRLICGPVHLYTTVGKVRNGLGDGMQFNSATQKAVDALEYTRSGPGAAEACARGIGGTWEGLQIQLDMAEF